MSNIRKYLLKRTSVQARKQNFRTRAKKLQKMIRGKIDDELYFRQSRETAADIISAHCRGGRFIDVGNTPNTGQISNLPAGAVVETAVVVDRNGINPVNFGALPDAVVGMIEPWCRTFTMTVDACMEKNKHQAIQALRLDPLCSHLNTAQLTEMANRLLRAHKKFISWL